MGMVVLTLAGCIPVLIQGLQLSRPAGTITRRPQLPHRAKAPTAQQDDSTRGVGFGSSKANEEAEARGRLLLEAMRAESGVTAESDKETTFAPTAEEQSSGILGIAGFLILGGVISLFVRGQPQKLPDGVPAGPARPRPCRIGGRNPALALGVAHSALPPLLPQVGGSLWEPNGANEDGTPPPESAALFGFAPKPPGS